METDTLDAAPARSRRALRHADDLPGPRGSPVFSNAFQIGPSRLDLQLKQWRREFGPVFRLHLHGCKSMRLRQRTSASA